MKEIRQKDLNYLGERKVNKMFITTTWMILGIMGFAIVFIGYALGGALGMIMGMGGGTMMIIPVMQVSTIIKTKRLVPWFMKLKDYEEISLYITERFQVWPYIFNNKNEGVLEKKKVGLIENKGTPLIWGSQPISITLQNCGLSVDLKKSQYVANLTENRGLETYEEGLKRFLGPSKYVEFCKKFRTRPAPGWGFIKDELNWLLDQEPNDPLVERVCGETINFKHYLNWLLYAYHPRSSINALNAEKIQTKREAMAYKEVTKGKNIGITIFLIILGIIIFLVVYNSIGGIF